MLILYQLIILTSNCEPLFLLFIHNLLIISIFCNLHRQIIKASATILRILGVTLQKKVKEYG